MERAAIETPTASRRTLATFAAGFALLLASGPIAYLALPKVQTQATPPWPEWSTTRFLDGHWAEALRRHAKESSHLTVTLRGLHGETEFLLGGYEAGTAIPGRGGSLFLRGDVVSRRPGIQKQLEARRARFADVARWAASREVRILALIPPDKTRIYPDLWGPRGEFPAGRRSEYRDLLEEFAAAGIPAVDLETLFADWRRARPAEPIYQDRDTHWNERGALLAALGAARKIAESGWSGELGTPDDLVASPLQHFESMPDLSGLLGFLPHGLFTDQLRQPQRAVAVLVREPSGATFLMNRQEPEARVALCGDSFAEVALGPSLAGVLGRVVDTEGAIAAGGPMRGLVETMERIDEGTLSARILVWVFVERSQGNEQWRTGPPVPGPR